MIVSTTKPKGGNLRRASGKRRYDRGQILSLRLSGATFAEITATTGANRKIIRAALRANGRDDIDEPAERRVNTDTVSKVPEASLAAEVIALAMSDLRATVMLSGIKNPHTQITPHERLEAEWFLTATDGEWAQSRERLADIAGICPDALRRAALRELGR